MMSAVAVPVLALVEPGDPRAFVAHGGCREFYYSRDHEVIIAGPYETGKTLAALWLLTDDACRYPGARILMVRKTYRSLVESACVTFERKVLASPPGAADAWIARHGGSSPTSYSFPNGSRIVLGGMDNPAKLLSSEWDKVYVNQAEELALAEWEALVGRATGRAGNIPHPQVLGDANPGPPTHWILHRPSLRMIESRHTDNPTLYNPETGDLTPRGVRTMSVLDALTGVRLQRGRYGKWVAAEGQVYDAFDRAIHLVDHFDPPPSWPRYWAVDFGVTNPFVWQEWVEDSDGRLYLHREIYRTRRRVQEHAEQIARLTADSPRPCAIICDHDEDGRMTLEQVLGMRTEPAYKSVSIGIQAMQARFVAAADGRPRLFIMRDSLVDLDEELSAAHKPVCTLDEVDVYIWPKAADGRPTKEAPVKEYDHGLDAARYLVAHVDRLSRAGVRDAGIGGDRDPEQRRRDEAPAFAGVRDRAW